MTTGNALGPRLTGALVRPGDDGYDLARTGWNGLFARRPAAVLFAETTADVVSAVAWARREGTELRIRSGGHSLEGWSSVDDGLVVDVSRMKSVSVDVAARTATVGAGLTQLEAVTALGRHGLAAPTGTEGSVGLVGATLGGGFGLLTRAFGMASDNLLAAEVVVATPDGSAERISVDESSHGDLLWALRGAGNGSFGVVTSLTYRVQPVPRAAIVTARWPGLAVLPEVFAAWQGSAPGADPRLTSQLEVHRDEVLLVAALVDGDSQQARPALADVLGIGRPEVSCADGRWAELYAGIQIPLADEPANWKFASQFISTPFVPAAIDVVASFMSDAPTSRRHS
jgi:FAD/FMN-containing dehydrogenase